MIVVITDNPAYPEQVQAAMGAAGSFAQVVRRRVMLTAAMTPGPESRG